MDPMARPFRVAFAAFIALSVGASAFASCLPGDPQATMEMACCQPGDDCGAAMQAADCCSSASVLPDKFVATKPATSLKPLMGLSFLPAAEPAAMSVATPSAAYHVGRLTSSSPPLFLLISSLRI